MVRSWVGGLALLTLVSACGDDEEEATNTASKPNEQASVFVAQQTISSVASLAGPSNQGGAIGIAVASALGNAAQSTQNVLQPDFGYGNGEEDEEGARPSSSRSIGGLVSLQGFRPLTTPPGYTGTCECTETSCTFAACKGVQNITIDGTYSWAGGKLVAKGLKFAVSTTQTAGETTLTTDATWSIDCDLTYSATSLDGTFRTNGNTKQSTGKQTVDASWNTTLTFKQVTFAANTGLPTGGSQHVSSTVNATVNGSAYVYGGDFDVTFPYQPPQQTGAGAGGTQQ
jgi:hypothetical protein